MGYMDAYRKRLRAETMSEAIKLDTDDNITREFKQSPSYKVAYLLDENLDETPLDIRMVNIDRTVFEKRLHLLPNTVVQIGQYIRVEEEYFIIKEVENNLASPYATVRYCNQVIKFPNGATLPCVAEGESYGVKMTATNDVILDTDAKVKLTIGDTPLGRTINPDFRVIFGHSKQGIYMVGDMTLYQKGLILFTCKKDKYIEGLDDLENNIAWQPDYDYDDKTVMQTEINYDIIGTREILAGKEYEYVLTPNALCSFAIDNQNVTVVKMTTYSITIRCDKMNEIFKLKAMIGDNIVAEKTIITMN